MAPEIIQERKYDQRVDIWSLGVIAYILLSGRPPFKGRTKQDIFNSIQDHPLTFDHPIWGKLSKEAKDFIKLALEKDFLKRPTAAYLLEHEWLTKQIKEPLIR
jgi:serine/threonine protein kinase